MPDAAAQTRIVSVTGIRLNSRESVRSFKGIISDDISEFECHAVRSLWGHVRVAELCARGATSRRAELTTSAHRLRTTRIARRIRRHRAACQRRRLHGAPARRRPHGGGRHGLSVCRPKVTRIHCGKGLRRRWLASGARHAEAPCHSDRSIWGPC
jgi:hypothetical protein